MPVVTNDEQLQNAILDSQKRPTTIRVQGRIDVSKPMYGGVNYGVPLVIEGLPPTTPYGLPAQLNMSALVTKGFGPKGETPPTRHGLEASRESITVKNLRVWGFEENGHVFKLDAANRRELTNVTGVLCGTVAWSYRVPNPSSAADAIYSGVLGSHGQPGITSIRGCMFDRCCTNEARWSHVVYADAPDLWVEDSFFFRCGSALSLGQTTFPYQRILIRNNMVRDPALAPRPDNPRSPVTAFEWYPTRVVAFDNTFSGTFASVWGGYPNPERDHIFRNNYEGVKGPFYTQMGVKTGTFAEWQALGFDRDSIAPTGS